MSTVVMHSGYVLDLTADENSPDPQRRLYAQQVLLMDKWARANGFKSYDQPPGASQEVGRQYYVAWNAIRDSLAHQYGDITQAESIALHGMLDSGDLVRTADGGYELSQAAAADAALGMTRNYGHGTHIEDQVKAATAAIIANAGRPAGHTAFVEQVRASAPDVFTPPPSAGGGGFTAPVPVADVTTAPPGGVAPIVAPAPQAAAPSATTGAPLPTTAGDVTVIIGDEQRTRQLLMIVGAVVLVMYLARRA